MVRGLTHMVHALVDENADLFHVLRYFGDNRERGFQSDVARASWIEDKAQRVRARIGGGERVVEVRHSADLDPSHKCSCQLSAPSKIDLPLSTSTDHYSCLFHQLYERFARAFRSHQRFADQECFVARRSQTSYVCAGLNSTLSHADACRRHLFRESECGFEIDFEGPQITAVDSDQVAAGVERAP